MNTETQTKLHGAIRDDFEYLKGTDGTAEERKARVAELGVLLDKAIEIEKLEAVREDNNLKKQTAKDEKVDRIVKNSLSALGIVLPLGVTIWGALKSWEFEEKGFVSSFFGKLFMNKLGPKK